MQMASALDTIIEHIQEKDPTAKNLFNDEDSETSTIIENPPPNMQSAQIINVDSDEKSDSNDVQMEMKEHSGTKRQYSADSPLKHRHGPDPTTQASPYRSPPPKKRTDQPSANPDNTDRERGQS
jgi:hypothetical protein